LLAAFVGAVHSDYVMLLTSSADLEVGGTNRRAGLPLVDSWDCLRDMQQAWQETVGPFDQYSMRHTRLFANLCNSGLNHQAVLAVSAASRGGGGSESQLPVASHARLAEQ